MYRVIKCILDFIFSLIGIIILSPLLIIVAILIKVTSKGPVIFKQERLGKNGKIFKVWKFRSMCLNAEKMEGGVYSSEKDQRVTKIGKFIRKTSIDELPQLFNILFGQMSFIGPRPALTYHPYELKDYPLEGLIRLEVRPGITGWAAVHGRKQVLWSLRFVYDAYYVEHFSFHLDVAIFFRTIYCVLFNKNNVNTSKTKDDHENTYLDNLNCELYLKTYNSIIESLIKENGFNVTKISNNTSVLSHFPTEDDYAKENIICLDFIQILKTHKRKKEAKEFFTYKLPLFISNITETNVKVVFLLPNLKNNGFIGKTVLGELYNQDTLDFLIQDDFFDGRDRQTVDSSLSNLKSYLIFLTKQDKLFFKKNRKRLLKLI